MSFTIEALLGIQPKVENEEIPDRILVSRSCSEGEESNEEDIELEGKSFVLSIQIRTIYLRGCQEKLNKLQVPNQGKLRWFILSQSLSSA